MPILRDDMGPSVAEGRHDVASARLLIEGTAVAKHVFFACVVLLI